MQPDDNDIIYQSYGLDLSPVIEVVYDAWLYISGGSMSGFVAATASFLNTLWTWWSVLAFIISALFIVGIIYSYLRLNEYGAQVTDKLEREHKAWQDRHAGARTGNARWEAVQMHARSGKPNDWRLAIIEADILLGEALAEKGYAGKSIGEQLKSISTNQLSTIRDAWDAHMVRNKIAHQGADFVVTQSMANTAIVKYERVLRELGVV